ncbi:hypothetical protein KY285_031106 [Solanum tuberosum]|nr:hypothetical protein KY285_031106 [Solanum tuberosum]
MGQQLLQKHKEEEKHVAVKEVAKEDIVQGDEQDFRSKYPRLAASFESMAGMSTMYPNGTSYLKEKMSLIATDKAKELEEKWKKLEDDEAALMVKRLDFIAEHYKLVVDAMRGFNQSSLCPQPSNMALGKSPEEVPKKKSPFLPKKQALRKRKKPFLPKKRALPSLTPSPIPATVLSPAPSPHPAAVPTLALSPGPATVSPVYAPVPSIEVPTSSPPAVEPPSPVLKPPAKPPKLRAYTNSSKPLPVNPPDKPQNGPNFPGINQEHRNYLIAAVAGCSVAGIAFLAVLIFCFKKKKKEIAPNDGRAKGWETASEFECRCLFAAIYHDGSSLNVKCASAVNDADPHKSSEADAELSKPEMNANAHAPVPLPPGKSAPPPPLTGPPPPPPPKPPPPNPPLPPKVFPPNSPKPGNLPKPSPLGAHQ